MIELPRGALAADQIASEAEFFSFGTNDLTQTTLGMSRDDYGSFIRHYMDETRSAARDPFQTIDHDGVGGLMKIGVEKGRGVEHEAQDRHLRRARRRPGVGQVLPQDRAELRELLAVPRADRPAGGGAGRFEGLSGAPGGERAGPTGAAAVRRPGRSRRSLAVAGDAQRGVRRAGAAARLPAVPGEPGGAAGGARRSAGGSASAGLNLTVPLKEHALPLLDAVTPLARRIGAVNTVKLDARAAHGRQHRRAGVPPLARGPGAAARRPRGADRRRRQRARGRRESGRGRLRRHRGGEPHARARRGAGRLATRRPGRARRRDGAPGSAPRRRAAARRPAGGEHDVGRPRRQRPARPRRRRTPTLPLRRPRLHPHPFLAAAARAGRPTLDGSGMLLHQGALAFEWWTGRRAPLSVMAAALLRPGRMRPAGGTPGGAPGGANEHEVRGQRGPGRCVGRAEPEEIPPHPRMG